MNLADERPVSLPHDGVEPVFTESRFACARRHYGDGLSGPDRAIPERGDSNSGATAVRPLVADDGDVFREVG